MWRARQLMVKLRRDHRKKIPMRATPIIRYTKNYEKIIQVFKVSKNKDLNPLSYMADFDNCVQQLN